jgi:aspartate oxidase
VAKVVLEEVTLLGSELTLDQTFTTQLTSRSPEVMAVVLEQQTTPEMKVLQVVAAQFALCGGSKEHSRPRGQQMSNTSRRVI